MIKLKITIPMVKRYWNKIRSKSTEIRKRYGTMRPRPRNNDSRDI